MTRLTNSFSKRAAKMKPKFWEMADMVRALEEWETCEATA
jgi:hypothetical protein